MKRAGQVAGAVASMIVGLVGCGGASDVPPVEYGEQQVRSKAQPGPAKHVTPPGMEPAESRSSNPLP